MPPGDLYSPKRFAIGLSFASERRDFVRAVADELLKELRQADVLYDHFHQEEFAAPSLHLRLPDFYAKDCEVVVVFICHFYANKDWTKDEWRAVMDLVLSGDHDRVLFVKFEEADLPGMRKGDGYIDARNTTPQIVAESAIKRLYRVRNSDQQKAIDKLSSANPSPIALPTSAANVAVPPTGARERLLNQRFEELQDRIGQLLDTTGSKLTSDLRQSLWRGETKAAAVVKRELSDWLLKNGELISSVVRCRIFVLLADYELQLAEDSHMESHSTEARKFLQNAKENSNADLGEEDSARLMSLEARLDYLDGRIDLALSALDGLTDPISLAVRLAILYVESRFSDAANLINDRELHERWADVAVRVHIANGCISDAENICGWSRSRDDQTTYQRCVLAFGQAGYHKVLQRFERGISIIPEDLTTAERNDLQLAVAALKPLLQAAEATGRITTSLQLGAHELALQISFLTERHDAATSLAQMLTSHKPISLEVGRAIVWGYLSPTDEIVERLRKERPGSFDAAHLAAVIEGGWLRRYSQSLVAARHMADSFSQPMERERIASLCSQLVEVLSSDEQEEAYELIVQMVGVDHRLTRNAQSIQLLKAGKLDELKQFFNDANAPSDLASRELLASYKEQLGDFEGAMNDLIVIADRCSTLSILWRTATLAAKAKQWDTAASFLERVVRRDPNSEQALEQLAVAHLQRAVSDGYLRAVECFAELAIREPDNPIFGLNHAQVLTQLGKLNEAVELLRVVCDRHPTFLKGFLVRSQLLLAIRRPLEAFELLDQPDVRQRFWGEVGFLQLYMSLGYRARREDAAAQARSRILELEQHLDESQRTLRELDLEQLREFFQNVAASHRQLNEMIVRGQLPWVCASLQQDRTIYGGWLYRTQAMVVPENVQDRGRFTTYSTNGFSVRPAKDGRPFLRRLSLTQPNNSCVLDVTSLMTLDRLGMLDTVIEYLGNVIIPQGV